MKSHLLIIIMEITATTNPYFNFTVFFYMDFSFNPYKFLEPL